MEKDKSGGKFEKFLAGKGFYIVLALCVAVIGVSAWVIASHPGAESVDIDPGVSISNDDPSEPSDGTAPVMNTDGLKDPIEDVVTDPSGVTGQWTQDDVLDEAPTTWVWPVSGGIERAHSIEALSYDVTMADWRTHDGVDITSENGAVVRAAADGTVESVKQDDMFGTVVVISHGGGIKTVYSSLADTPTVSAGDTVKAGDVIGSVGDTALCEVGEPSHLHFAMSQDGESVDPMNYLPE